MSKKPDLFAPDLVNAPHSKWEHVWRKLNSPVEVKIREVIKISRREVKIFGKTIFKWRKG